MNWNLIICPMIRVHFELDRTLKPMFLGPNLNRGLIISPKIKGNPAGRQRPLSRLPMLREGGKVPTATKERGVIPSPP